MDIVIPRNARGCPYTGTAQGFRFRVLEALLGPLSSSSCDGPGEQGDSGALLVKRRWLSSWSLQRLGMSPGSPTAEKQRKNYDITTGSTCASWREIVRVCIAVQPGGLGASERPGDGCSLGCCLAQILCLKARELFSDVELMFFSKKILGF